MAPGGSCHCFFFFVLSMSVLSDKHITYDLERTHIRYVLLVYSLTLHHEKPMRLVADVFVILKFPLF